MLHLHRHSRHDALARFERIARTANSIARFNLPQDAFKARECKLNRCNNTPTHFARFACGNINTLLGQFKQGGAGRNLHFHRSLGGVAQSELGAEFIALAHERRQAADDLQILRGGNRGLPRTEAARAMIGHRYDFELRNRIIEWHLHRGLAVGIELHSGIPEQQCIKQLTRLPTPAATSRRHGFAAIVPAANNFHLRGRCFYAPTAGLEHGIQQIPCTVGREF